jgi:hypothetical protein
MTQDLRTQPVQTPEQSGMLRNAFEAVRGLPPVMGAEMTARGTADKAPTRREAVALLGAAVLAAGVGASEASAQVEGSGMSPEEYAQACEDNALKRPTYLKAKYVMKKNAEGKRVRTKEVEIDFLDDRTTPNIQDRKCNGKRSISFYQIIEPDRGKKKGVKNTKVEKVTPNDEANLSSVAYEGEVELDTFRKYKKKNGRIRNWAIRVRKTWDPDTGPTKSRTYTFWIQKRADRSRPVQRVQ